MTHHRNDRLRLGLVIGSTREGRFGPTVARWFAAQVKIAGAYDLDLIDLAHREWFAKPIAFVSYGGLAGGLRAVEHLRLVFAELHTATIRETVSFHNAHNAFAPDGNPHYEQAPQEAAARMLQQLTWWATALRTARTSSQYPA